MLWLESSNLHIHTHPYTHATPSHINAPQFVCDANSARIASACSHTPDGQLLPGESHPWSAASVSLSEHMDFNVGAVYAEYWCYSGQRTKEKVRKELYLSLLNVNSIFVEGGRLYITNKRSVSRFAPISIIFVILNDTSDLFGFLEIWTSIDVQVDPKWKCKLQQSNTYLQRLPNTNLQQRTQKGCKE